jgi:hypothetical protein
MVPACRFDFGGWQCRPSDSGFIGAGNTRCNYSVRSGTVDSKRGNHHTSKALSRQGPYQCPHEMRGRCALGAARDPTNPIIIRENGMGWLDDFWRRQAAYVASRKRIAAATDSTGRPSVTRRFSQVRVFHIPNSLSVRLAYAQARSSVALRPSGGLGNKK